MKKLLGIALLLVVCALPASAQVRANRDADCQVSLVHVEHLNRDLELQNMLKMVLPTAQP